MHWTAQLCIAIGLFVNGLLEILPAEAQDVQGVQGVLSTAVNCPNTAFLALDGCKAAPAYNDAAPAISYQDRSVFSDGVVFQTPGMQQLGVAMVTWNVPGRDFAVGVSPGRYCDGPYESIGKPAKPCSTTPKTGGSLIDAARYDWPADPAHFCAGATSTSYEDGTKSVICRIADGGLNIQGFDFTPNGICVTFGVLEAPGTTGYGTIDFKNNRFVQPSAGHACYGKRYDPLGVLTTTPIYMHPNARHAWNFEIENNWLDPRTSTTHSGQGMGMIDVGSAGSAIFRYNYLGDMASRSVNAAVCGSFNFSFNFVPSMGQWPNDAHGEIFLARIEAGVNSSMNYCSVDENGVVQISGFNVVNNFAVGRYGISGATFNSPLLINLSGQGFPPITIGETTVELNTVVANYVRPHHAYVLSYLSAGALKLDFAGSTGEYATGDILAIENGCDVRPTVRLYDVSGSGSETNAHAEAWTGGDCAVAPSSKIAYVTSCQSCGHSPEGLKVQTIGGYANSMSGNGLIALGQSKAAGAETHLNLTIANNALDALGAAGGRAIVVNNGGSTLCAASMNTAGNFNLETGATILFPGGVSPC